MIDRFKIMLKNIFSKKEAPSLESFRAFEKTLKRNRPKPRPAFEQALKSQLMARHQAMRESQLEKGYRGFRFYKFATVTAVFVFAIGGGAVVVASPNPMPESRTFAALSDEKHPNMAPISVNFDQPMMKNSVESAFSITPQVAGNFIWNKNTLYFLPNEPLDTTVEYTITLNSGAKSWFQKPLKEDYERTFTPIQTPNSANPNNPQFAAMDSLRNQTDRPLTPEEMQVLRQEFIEIEIFLNESLDPATPEHLKQLEDIQRTRPNERPAERPADWVELDEHDSTDSPLQEA